MTSTVPIATTIDHLTQRINNAQICQHHFKPIAAKLNRLRPALTSIDTSTNDTHSLENISQILEAIDEVVTGCTTNETDFNGTSYRDLESLLLRLHWHLVQFEVDITDDHETKMQILTNTHQEQQLLMQTSFDQTLKQRLETIEQRAKQNSTAQLRLLRDKHTETIESYLRSCIEHHKNESITGITTDSVVKVAHTYYQISSEDQAQLKHQWQPFALPLTRTFSQLKPDQLTLFERNVDKRLLLTPTENRSPGQHREKETSKGIWHKLMSAPYMMSMIGLDQKTEKDNTTEENMIRTKRWIMILGDPGSGKTSFVRRIIHHLAQTFLLKEKQSTEYGPLRIPILICIDEFAEMLKNQPSLTLFDYVGKHKWIGNSIIDNPSITLDDLSSTLQDYIKQGQALIILDGLDAISLSDQRSKIINSMKTFVETYVQTPTRASDFDNSHLNKLFDDPSKTGGNQLIVTSRITGYHAAPLSGQFTHYTIQRMDKEHIKDYVNYWFSRLHQQILDTLNLTLPNQGENHGEALKKELEKPDNVGLLDLASNPYWLSHICSLTFNQLEGSPLSAQRIRL
jgi:GTPase SAR1 family protein